MTVSLPVLRWAGGNTDLPLGSNISKTLRVNIAFAATFLKEYSTSFLMVCRLIDFSLVVLKLLMFKVCVIIGISKIEIFNFSGTERFKKNWLETTGCFLVFTNEKIFLLRCQLTGAAVQRCSVE